MAKNRLERVKGTKDFLVAAVVCIFFGLWCVSDGWFPAKRVLKKHPKEFAVTSSVPGIVQDIPVHVGQDVGGDQVLVTLNPEHFEEAVAAAEEAYKAVRGGAPEEVKDLLDALAKAREELEAATVTCDAFLLETTHGETSLRGRVLEILTQPATEVEAGTPLMLVRPKDTFYAFNQTSSVLLFILSAVFLFFHRVASK